MMWPTKKGLWDFLIAGFFLLCTFRCKSTFMEKRGKNKEICVIKDNLNPTDFFPYSTTKKKKDSDEFFIRGMWLNFVQSNLNLKVELSGNLLKSN